MKKLFIKTKKGNPLSSSYNLLKNIEKFLKKKAPSKKAPVIEAGFIQARNLSSSLHEFTKKIKKYQLFFYFFSGITNPAEIISLAASSTDISRRIMSFLGTNNIKPDVGFGVVGKKTVTREPTLIFFLISPKVSVEIKATAHTLFLGTQPGMVA